MKRPNPIHNHAMLRWPFKDRTPKRLPALPEGTAVTNSVRRVLDEPGLNADGKIEHRQALVSGTVARVLEAYARKPTREREDRWNDFRTLPLRRACERWADNHAPDCSGPVVGDFVTVKPASEEGRATRHLGEYAVLFCCEGLHWNQQQWREKLEAWLHANGFPNAATECVYGWAFAIYPAWVMA